MPLPGVAVSILVIGLSAMIFFGVTNLLAMRFAGAPAADAWLDLFGNPNN